MAGIAMMEPILDLDEATWLAQPQALKRFIGAGSRSFRGPIWQLDPDGASHPGVYAFFLFTGKYTGLAAHCGLIVLYRAGPGQYAVTQQTIQVVARSSVASGEVSREAARAACAEYVQ
jgi:hypothetical protein